MTGPEQQDRLAHLAEPFHQPQPVRTFYVIRILGVVSIKDFPRHATLLGHAAFGEKRPGLLRGNKFANIIEIAGIECLDPGRYRAAAALAEIRTERPDPYRRGGGLL